MFQSYLYFLTPYLFLATGYWILDSLSAIALRESGWLLHFVLLINRFVANVMYLGYLLIRHPLVLDEVIPNHLY